MLKNKIKAMHEMYDLPVNDTPQFYRVTYEDIFKSLSAFKDILNEEVAEADDIIRSMHDLSIEEVNHLVAIADWLADITIYCRSEAMKYGIPLEEVIDIIMDSNMSKLGEDGEPIKDERGKVLKGVNYWKPEPKIKELLLSRMQESGK